MAWVRLKEGLRFGFGASSYLLGKGTWLDVLERNNRGRRLTCEVVSGRHEGKVVNVFTADTEKAPGGVR